MVVVFVVAVVVVDVNSVSCASSSSSSPHLRFEGFATNSGQAVLPCFSELHIRQTCLYLQLLNVQPLYELNDPQLSSDGRFDGRSCFRSAGFDDEFEDDDWFDEFPTS
jgi:hypothetical protein